MEKVQAIGVSNSLTKVFSKKRMKVHALSVFFKKIVKCCLKVSNKGI